MKKLFKKLALMVVALLAFSVGSNYTVKEVKAAEVVDVLDNAFTGVGTGTTYKDWNNKVGTSGAVYKGQSAGDSSTIQLRSKNSNSGIVSTTSGGIVKSIVLTWNSKTSSGRTVDIYGANSAFTAATELYNSNATKVGSIVFGSTTYNFTEEYQYIGIRSNSGALYLDKIEITWSSGNSSETPDPEEPETPVPSMSISGDAYTQIGEEITLTESHENVEGTVVWSSSNETVASVVDGVVTPLSMGQTTITAAINETTATKVVTVYPKANTELTIEEALEVCELTGTTNAPYVYSVTGTIKSIDTAYDSGYGNITVTITDGANSIKAFRMKGGDDLYVDVEITVTGTLVNYSGNTPEFIAGCTYVINEIDYKKIISTFSTTASLGFDYSLTYEEQEVNSVVNEYTATLSFANIANRTAYSTTSQVWSQNGIALTNDKGSSSNDVNDSYNPVRLYKNSTITIALDNSEGKITKIIFNDVSGYKVNTSADTIGVATVNDDGATVVTVNEQSQSSSITFTASANQLRLTSITVTYEVKTEGTVTEEVVKNALFDNISILFGATVETSLFETFASVKAGVMFSSGNTLDVENAVKKEVETLVENNGVYSVGAVLEVFADGEVVTDGTKERLSKNVTAAVYFVLDGETVILEPKTYSVETMVDHYVTNAASLGIEDQYTIDALKALQAYIAA